MKVYDVAVIGAGVCGSLIARELSKYNLSVCILEKGPDAASGISKANSGIVHSGFDAKNGSLKAKLNLRGAEIMEKVASQLHVSYKRVPSIVVCLEGQDRTTLDALLERGIKNGVKDLRIIEKDELKTLEPNISDKAVCALVSENSGIISPYELAIFASENAVMNGAEFFRNFEVSQISEKDGILSLSNGTDTVFSKFAVNAAGLHSSEICRLTGDDNFKITPRKGEYMLFDHDTFGYVKNVVFPMPSEKGKGILVSPTADGNMLIGPNAEISDPDDTSTTASGLAEILESAKKYFNNFPANKVITSFAGQRPTPDGGDFIIKKSEKFPHILHLAGIESPGLASSPAIAEYVVELLSNMGLCLAENKKFDPCNKNIKIRDMSFAEREEYYKKNPLYAKIICRCESVTEGEIIDAIHSPLGAVTVDGIKFRTRAGMGRCQSGFCLPKITEILARELKIDQTDISKKGKDSKILAGRTK